MKVMCQYVYLTVNEFDVTDQNEISRAESHPAADNNRVICMLVWHMQFQLFPIMAK